MHSRIVVVTGLLAVLGWGCGQDETTPSLRITPSGDSGTIQVSEPTQFTAEQVNNTNPVTWMLAGTGTLSNTDGLHVVYTPPIGAETATLTATAGLLTASVKIAATPKVSVSAIPSLVGKVTVKYDAQDIPHIECAAMIDCFAVQGYLQARDRWFPMDFLRHVAEGKLSELIGIVGLDQDVQLRTLFTTRSGARLNEELAAVLDPTTRPLMEAFVRGINAYLAELRKSSGPPLPAEYKQLPFPITAAEIEDWTVADTLALARLQQFQLSETIEEETGFGQFALTYAPGVPGVTHPDAKKLTAWIRAAAPRSEQAHTLAAAAFHPAGATARSARGAVRLRDWKAQLEKITASSEALRNFLRPAGAAVGSNNWVVSGAKSANHSAMVANDPHLALQYPPLFHLSVMTSSNAGDNLNLAGGAFPGIPGALVGRGAHVGWGVTVVGYDVTDVYSEQFSAACPAEAPCVRFKNADVPLIVAPQVYNVRVGPGKNLIEAQDLPIPDASKPPPFVLVVPHHGPIIRPPDNKGKTFSVRWTGHEANTQDVKAIFGLNTAASVDAAIEALKGFATGAQNFVLADDQGHIAYDPHALVPVRRFADIRIDPTHPERLQAPWLPLSGDTGTAEWGDGVSDCASATATPVPASCWISDAELPHGKDPDKGYFATANADPLGVSDDNNPLAHPPYLSFRWDDSTGFRATRIDQMLAAAVARGGVTLDDMQAIQADHISRPGMLFAPIIAAVPTDTNSPDALIQAKLVLQQWAANGFDCPTGLVGTDPRTSAKVADAKIIGSSAGCFLFHAFLRTLVTNVFTDDLAFAHQSVNGVSALKAIIYMLTEGTTDEDTTFCDDVDPATGDKLADHSCPEQVGTALVQAYSLLAGQLGPDPANWVWGRVHTMQPVSLLALVTTNFQPGPYARPGGAFTVDVGSPSLTGGGLAFNFVSSGNVRHISVMDPAKPVIKMQLPGPQRDGPTIFVGPDLLGQWVNNTYFDFAFGSQIDALTVSTQTFNAGTP